MAAREVSPTAVHACARVAEHICSTNSDLGRGKRAFVSAYASVRAHDDDGPLVGSATKAIHRGRHVEIQDFDDAHHGNVA